jgi:uncharacterized protein (PEP-CTERM system associated)
MTFARRVMALLAAAVLCAAGARALAQTPPVFAPAIAVGETWSDNPTLTAGDAHEGWITEVSPGLQALRNGAVLDFFMDARWHFLRFSSPNTAHDNDQGYLDAKGRIKAWDRVGIEGVAQVSQQTLDPFGPAATPDRANLGTNHVETRLLQAGPYARGEVGDVAAYEARAIASGLRTSGDALPSLRALEFDAGARNPHAASLMRWTADLRGFEVRPDGGSPLADWRARATLGVNLYHELHLSLVYGRDETDFLADERESGPARGVLLAWNPSPRTHLAGVFERRFYGNAHKAEVAYRTPRTAWRAASVHDLTILPNILAPGVSSSAVALMSDLLASTIADLQAREIEARRRLDEAALAGTPPLSASFVPTRPVEYREDEIAGALLGVRSTLTLRADRREQRARGPSLAPSLPVVDQDFRQKRYSAQWSHRLTPLATFALEAAWLDVESLEAPVRRTRERLATASFTVRPGPHLTVRLGLRHAFFDRAGFDSFDERAVFALFTVQL